MTDNKDDLQQTQHQDTGEQISSAPSNQTGNFLDNPKVGRYLGRATKAMAFFAILGSIVILVAVTAISNLINNALDSIK